jgi:Holliday junction resolvasome RuvABC endonuclease subunit
MRVLGIDVGFGGAVGVIELNNGSAPKFVAVDDIPTIGVDAKRRVDALALAIWIAQHPVDLAGIEAVSSMPKQGIASAFKFGRTAGVIEAVIAISKIPVVFVAASRWKRALNLSSDKEASRQLAVQTFPAAHDQLCLKKHHGRAESLLIALHIAREANQ